MGLAGDGLPSEQYKKAHDDFYDQLEKRNFPKKKSETQANTYLLGVHMGADDVVGTRDQRTRQWKRQKTVADTVGAMRDIQKC